MKLKKILFMLQKAYRDIFNSSSPYLISKDLRSKTLGEYYFLFEDNPAKLNRLIQGFDKKGIPLNKSYIDVNNDELNYYPISIGQYALALFNKYILTKDEKKLKQFIVIADWFLDNVKYDKNNFAYWVSDVPKPEYKVFDPWKSAFVQSRAISVLLRAWQVTNNNKYFDVASKSLGIFNLDVKEGGVSAITEKGKFYEEYVASEHTMVLDGHLFSLLGLYDFYRAVESPPLSIQAKKLFDEGIESLINWLPEYDMGYWLRFNMCKMDHYPKIDPCTIGYLRLVSLQLRLLYLLTQNETLKKYYSKFEKYDKPYNILKSYIVKFKALRQLGRI